MFLWLALACDTSSEALSLHCTLDTPVFSPAEAAPGDTVVATTAPLTEVWDTTVQVGTDAASVVAVDRNECSACDTCRETVGCTSCDECTDCAEDCATCVQTVSFTVPAVAVGATTVTITNIHGATAEGRLVVVESSADTGDTGDTADTAD